MDRPWVSRGLSVGCPWAVHGATMRRSSTAHVMCVGSPCIAHRLPMGCLWGDHWSPMRVAPCDCPLGIPLSLHGRHVDSPRVAHDSSPMGFLSLAHGVRQGVQDAPIGCSWGARGAPTHVLLMGCPWAVRDLSVTRPWVTRGSPVGCPWVARGFPLGCPWGICGTRMGRPSVTPMVVRRKPKGRP